MRQGKQYVLFAGLLDEAHSRGLRGIDTELVQVPTAENGNVAVVKATVEMEDGRTFSGIGDASPENVGRNIAPHIIRMAECVSLNAQILTKEGWKTYDRLSVGELVLAYDVEADYCRWVPLQAVTVYEKPRQTLRLEGRSFSAEVTPEHTWAVAKKGKRVSAPQRILRKTNELRTSDDIVVAAIAESGTHLLSEKDAAVLGWLATDGTIRQDRGYNRGMIFQSKQGYVSEIRELLADRATEAVVAPGERDFSRGPSKTLQQHRFSLRAGYLRRLQFMAGLRSWSDLPRLVLSLSGPARAAMLDAMLKGDGARKRDGASWEFGTKSKKGVMEAWELLATLEGKALGRLRESSVGNVPVRIMRSNRLVHCNYLDVEPGRVQPVWCPTTPLGTWIMRQPDGTISITGNTRAKARALRDAVNVGATALEELSDGDESGAAPSNYPPPRNLQSVPQRTASGGDSTPSNGRAGAEPEDAEDVPREVPRREGKGGAQKARKSQIDLLRTLAEELRGENGVARLESRIGKSLGELTRAEADEWIDRLTPAEGRE